MRIERLELVNFKCFKEREFRFHPDFNLVVGVNGSGKTALLEALSVAIGSWLLGFSGADSRHIRQSEVRLVGQQTDSLTTWESQYPCRVASSGMVGGYKAQDEQKGIHPVTWSRELLSEKGRTTSRDVKELTMESRAAYLRAKADPNEILPLVSYYGAGRLWSLPNASRELSTRESPPTSVLSRLHGYSWSVDPRIPVRELEKWIERHTLISFQRGGEESPVFKTVQQALVKSILSAKRVFFDAAIGRVAVEFEGSELRQFSDLSDGQRTSLALVGDIARKAGTLNPSLGLDVLRDTPGVVLIDELDLHLHPTWQRQVAEDLRTIFPRIQFICTTHSPFVIQSLRNSSELIQLDEEDQDIGQFDSLPNKSIEEIARVIQEVERPEVSRRYEVARDASKSFLQELSESTLPPGEKLERFKRRLADATEPFADNPALQAFLELKLASQTGETQ